ncbi:MAG TPA: helix-turn-helix transcriptional regulator [Polyangiaceae bacterium]|nr:helix-turn-helix transcriptional regulator [Polyangiaceae bacterium]
MAIAVGRETDCRALAREILWYLRAERSQREFARLIGCRSNTPSAWETSRTFPSAERLLAICDRLGIDVLWVLSDFAPECACTLEGMTASALSLGAWLDALRGEAPLNAPARASGFSRHQLGRWLRGAASPSLPEFLLLVQVCSGRLDELLSKLLPPPTGPRLGELKERRHALWRRLRETRSRGPALRS